MRKIEDCLILIDEIRSSTQELKELNVSDDVLQVLEHELKSVNSYVKRIIRVTEKDSLHEISIP